MIPTPLIGLPNATLSEEGLLDFYVSRQVTYELDVLKEPSPRLDERVLRGYVAYRRFLTEDLKYPAINETHEHGHLDLPERFKRWCAKTGRQALPASLETVLLYLRSHRRKLPRACLQEDRQSIIWAHAAAGFNFPSLDELTSTLLHEFVLEAYGETPLADDYTFGPVSLDLMFSDIGPILGALNSVSSTDRDDERSAAVTKEYHRQLRALMDEYLNTGVQEDGSEAPLERDAERAPLCKKAMETGRNNLRLCPPRSGLATKNWVIGFSPDACQSPDPILQGRAYAECVFTLLMISDPRLRLRIAKCRYGPCGNYFLRPSKPDRPRRHGTFCCAPHQMAAMTLPKTSKKRHAEKEALVREAARRLSEWESRSSDWRKRNPQKRWLAKELNRFIPQQGMTTRHNLTVKWVTENLAAIQAARNSLEPLIQCPSASPELTSSGSARK